MLRKADRGPEVEATQLVFVPVDLSCAGDTLGSWGQPCRILESGRLGVSPGVYAGSSKVRSPLGGHPIP